MSDIQVVAIGASWGGISAMIALLNGLPDGFTTPLVLVQHRGRGRSGLVPVLARHTNLSVREAEDKMPMQPSTLYVAPADYHLLAEPGRLALSTDAPVRHSRPSIDVLFASVAEAYRTTAIGLILTGAGRDGAAGLAEIARRGGHAMIENPDAAVEPSMPMAAWAAVPGAEALSLPAMGGRLAALGNAAAPAEWPS